MKRKVKLGKSPKAQKSTMVLPEVIFNYIEIPDKYVYPFVIKEKNGKERSIITYNKFGNYGPSLRVAHEKITDAFRNNFYIRNSHSFAYHENVRCLDALTSHLKSSLFIKLDIHHFFESITEEAFFNEYGEYFNEYWTNAIKGLFYKGSLSIGFVSSPIISDFYMKKFDNAIEKYLKDYPELHYSRYSDDILLSSELDDENTLNQLFDFVKKQLKLYRLEINDKKTRKIKLDYETHNSISYLGLNISKSDSVNNKVTISKRYILFLLFLIAKQKGYKDHCYPLDNEIKSRVAYLAYNSPISYQRFQKKHTNIYGEPYRFTPKVLENRSVARVSDEIENFDEYSKLFKINIHKKIAGPSKYGFVMNDAIEIEQYIGAETEVVEIPYFVDSIGPKAFANSHKIKKVVLNKKLKNIDKDAFYGSSIEEINLPEALRVIDEGAFRSCNKLKSIVIPAKVKVIGASAFSFCFSLSDIKLSEGIETIGEKAFENCTKISEITLPESLKHISSNAFSGCSLLSNINLKSSKIETIESSAFDDCVLLKEAILPNTLLRIGPSAFNNCCSLKHVYVPASALEVSSKSFTNCPRLSSLEVSPDNKVYEHRDNNDSLVTISGKELLFTIKNTIDSDIKSLTSGLFMNSTIKSIEIPEGVETIKDSVFEGAYLLKKVTLPKNLKSLGAFAFAKCNSLEEITIPDGIVNIPNYLFQSCPRLRKVHMSNNVKSIGISAFENDGQLEICLPESLTEIKANAFKNCLNNKELFIPEKVKRIGKNAFLGLSKVLESIKVNPLNTTYSSGDDSNVIYEFKKAMVILGCKNSVIEQGIRVINKYAFAYCDGLTKISMPDTVKSIEMGAFIDCKNLKDVDLNIVSTIEDYAFEGNASLRQINLPNSITYIGNRAFYNSGLKVLKLPNSLTDFGSYVFDNCFDLEELYFPATFKFNSIYQYSNCPNIRRIEIDPKNPTYSSGESLNAVVSYNSNGDGFLKRGCSTTIIDSSINVIQQGAFAGDLLLESIVIPRSVREISSSAFKGCHNLKKVVINASIDAISNSVFEDCVNLKEVIINSPNVLAIESGAFKNCGKLKEITLPNYLRSIGRSAFERTSLTTITLPFTLEKIGFFVFGNCKNLKKVVLPANDVLEIENDAFFGCESLTQINLDRVKSISTSQTFRATNIEKFALSKNAKFANESTTKLFKDCPNLKEVIIPEGIKVIGPKTFMNDEKLVKVIIPEGVEKLSTNCFANCKSLESITLPDSIKMIGDCAFLGCTNLKSINFPANLKQIGSAAFKGCPNLVLPSFPDKLEYIGLCAFEGNMTIKDVYLPASIGSLASTAFVNTSIEHIKVDPNNRAFKDEDADVVVYFDKNKGKSVLFGCKNSKIPDDVQYIDSYAFYKMLDIKHISLPSRLEEIGSSAFEECSNLEELICPDNLKRIGESAFRGCVNMKKVTFNNRLLAVNDDAFSFVSVDELKLPASLVNIVTLPEYNKITIDPNNVRYEAVGTTGIYDKLTKTLLCINEDIDIPLGCRTINYGCFNGVPLKKVFVPEGVITINTSFDGCGVIEELHLPSTVSSVSFDYRTFIKKIYVDENNPFFTTNDEHTALLNIFKTELIYLCEEGLIPEGVKSIRGSFVREGTKQIHIPSTLTMIPTVIDYKFDGKVKVAKDNPFFEERDNTVVRIEKNELCLFPVSAKIPESVTRLRRNAFGKGLKSIYIPKNVQFMELNCFEYATDLASIVVDKDNPIFDSRDNCNAVIVTEKNVVIAKCKNTKVPDGVNPGKYVKVKDKPIVFLEDIVFGTIKHLTKDYFGTISLDDSTSFGGEDYAF